MEALMDKFYVVRNSSQVLETFTSEAAAKEHIYTIISGTPDHNVYTVAHVIATSRTMRIWNTP
jgi:hypothetical protein